MRVLITGAAGFLGSHLCDYFLSQGHSVIGLDNFVTGSMDNLEPAMKHDNFSFIECNVIDEVPKNVPQVDVVLHFACPASPKDYLAYPELTLKVDSIGTFNVLEKAASDNARFLMASTSEIYGDPEQHPQTESYWGNVNPIGIRSVYDEAKRFSEAASMAFHRYRHVDTRIVRIFNTYGPRMRLNDGRVVPNFITQALRHENLTVYGDGTQTRSFCYVDDLVRGIYSYALIDVPLERVINLGNPDEYTILEFARIVSHAVKNESGIQFEPLPLDDPRQRRPDISLARQIIGWKPEIQLSIGLQKTVDYFKGKVKLDTLSS